jgi:hypothetical protein
MAKLKLPLWFVIERHPPRPSPTSDADSGGVYAFTEVHHVMEFMSSRTAMKRELTHAKEHGALIMVIANAHAVGESYIRLNPNLDGSGGERIPLADLIAI